MYSKVNKRFDMTHIHKNIYFFHKYCTFCKRSRVRPIIFTNYRLQRYSSVSFEVIFTNRYLEDIFIVTSNVSILHLFKKDIEDWKRWRKEKQIWEAHKTTSTLTLINKKEVLLTLIHLEQRSLYILFKCRTWLKTYISAF